MSTQKPDAKDAKNKDKPNRRRITADLLPDEFEVLEQIRVLEAASTTDLARALLRLYSSDPELAQRIKSEIAVMRQEKLESRRQNGRIWQRKRGATPHALIAEGLSVA